MTLGEECALGFAIGWILAAMTYPIVSDWLERRRDERDRLRWP